MKFAYILLIAISFHNMGFAQSSRNHNKNDHQEPDLVTHGAIFSGKIVGGALLRGFGSDHEAIASAKKEQKNAQSLLEEAVKKREANVNKWNKKIANADAEHFISVEEKAAKVNLLQTIYITEAGEATAARKIESAVSAAQTANLLHAAFDEDRTIAGALLQNAVGSALMDNDVDKEEREAREAKRNYVRAVNAKVISPKAKEKILSSLKSEMENSDKPFAAAEASSKTKLDQTNKLRAEMQEKYGPGFIKWPLKKLSSILGWTLLADSSLQGAYLAYDMSPGGTNRNHHFSPLIGGIIIDKVLPKKSAASFDEPVSNAERIIETLRVGR